MLNHMVENRGDDQPHQPEKDPTVLPREREPDEKRVPQVDSDAVADELQRPESNLLE
jgi:hypothetical protein